MFVSTVNDKLPHLLHVPGGDRLRK
jgi:hypothetical protein